MHVASTLGQLDGIPLEGVKAYISGAESVQELIDMPYPADEIAKVQPKFASSVGVKAPEEPLTLTLTQSACAHG